MKRLSFYRSLPVLLAACVFAGCQETSTTPTVIADATAMPADVVLYGVHHTMTQGGVRSSVLDADSAYQHEEQAALDLRGVKLVFYNETGGEAGRLTSRSGEFASSEGNFIARDDVVLITSGPGGERRIETEELRYEVSTDQIWTDKPFVMTQGGRTTRGTSFRSDGKFTNWTIDNMSTSGGLPAEGSGLSF